MMSNLKFELSSLEQNHHSLSQGGFHRPTDCCMSYTPRNIRCVFMENYIETSSACSRPAVIFMTKKGQRVCADPNNEGVQKCKSELRLGSAVEDLRSLLLERGRLDRAPSTPSLLPHHPHWRAVAWITVLKSSSYCSVLITNTTHSSRVSNLTSLKLLEGKDCVGIAELWIRVAFLGVGRVWTRYHSVNFFKLKTWHSNTDLVCVFNPLITKPIQRSSEEQKFI